MDLQHFFEGNEDLFRIINKYHYPKSSVHVYSLDISPESEADYVADFNSFSEDWDSKWDFIYSNALDHSISPTDAFREWVRVLKSGGLMILGFVFDEDPEESINSNDCCSFTREQVVDFIESEKNIKIINNFSVDGYDHFVIAKK